VRPAATMTVRDRFLFSFVVLAAASAFGQAISTATAAQPVVAPSSSATSPLQSTGVAKVSPASQLQLEFRDSDIKFDLQRLTSTLRDQRHEGWVLAAYPDPKTRRPLIGAGFSLDLPERVHAQSDPLNPQPFLEPSSADLWQAAGLDSARLQATLAHFDDNMAAWSKMKYRKRIRYHALEPDVTSAEAEALLRISAIQAIHNARAYCRNFDALTGPQQMALSQLVFQMGVNLEEFGQFLSVLNGDAGSSTAQSLDAGHWQTVQQALIESQWARLYRVRAASVIAMFDPVYGSDPSVAQRRVDAILRPPARRGRRGHAGASLRMASYHKRSGKAHGKASRGRSGRRVS
jgi:hypothetical protein